MQAASNVDTQISPPFHSRSRRSPSSRARPCPRGRTSWRWPPWRWGRGQPRPDQSQAVILTPDQWGPVCTWMVIPHFWLRLSLSISILINFFVILISLTKTRDGPTDFQQIFNEWGKEMHYNYSYISREMKYRRKEESMYLNKIIPTWTQEKSLFTLTRWIYFQISDPSVRACSLIQRYPSTSADCCLQTSPLHTNTWKVSCSLSIANSYNTGFKHLIRCIEGTQ